MENEKYLVGLEGEKIIRDYLKNKNIHFFQADLMAKIKKQWIVIEIKHQEVFDPPPFKGHGLPKWQIDTRLEFQKETGIAALLFIVDKISKVIYWQYMDKLMKGKQFQTKGLKPRIIFPLESYNIMKKE